MQIKISNKIVRNLVILTISICFGLLLGEFVLRYIVKAWPFEKPLYVFDYLTERDKQLRWRFSSSGGRNSLGLRNKEVAEKKKGTYRIVFLGDSLVWEGATSSGKLYTEVIEQRLNKRAPDRKQFFEVINAGVPGYTTYQEFEFLKIYGIGMEPDLVMLGFALNDLHYKYLHKPVRKDDPGINITIDLEIEPSAYLHQFNTNALPGVLFAKSYLAHEVAKKGIILWRKLSRHPVFPFEQRADSYLAWKNYGWTDVQKLIGEMQELLRKKNILFLIVVFPISDQMNNQYLDFDKAYVLYPQDKIKKICDGFHIQLIELTGPIYKNGGTTLFQDYLHLNHKGNDTVADELEKYLINEMRLIPP